MRTVLGTLRSLHPQQTGWPPTNCLHQTLDRGQRSFWPTWAVRLTPCPRPRPSTCRRLDCAVRPVLSPLPLQCTCQPPGCVVVVVLPLHLLAVEERGSPTLQRQHISNQHSNNPHSTLSPSNHKLLMNMVSLRCS